MKIKYIAAQENIVDFEILKMDVENMFGMIF